MKKRVYIFIGVVLLALSVVPAFNLKFGNAQKKEGEKWWHRSVLYNMDFALPYLSRALYPFGISTAPNQVIVGKNHWLYLGDQYEKTVTTKRRESTLEDKAGAEKIAVATMAWERWLKFNGVKEYRVMVGPDKESVYPEFQPKWASATVNAPIETLFASVNPKIYVDMRADIKAAKKDFTDELYYKTDTHWNNLGAWVAFQNLAKSISTSEPDLQWPTIKQLNIVKGEKYGGDLANFLRIAPLVRDKEFTTSINTMPPIETEQRDFQSGKILFSGGNPNIVAPHDPMLVISKNALNKKRVLWLRDSFGAAMAPYMSATFSEVLQMHYSGMKSEQYVKLVEAFKPDFVFITVVERDARAPWFQIMPPVIVESGKPKDFSSASHGTQTGFNDLVKIESTDTFRVTGEDSFITFVLSRPINPKQDPQLFFQLDCGVKKEPVKLQIFWHAAGVSHTEDTSTHVVAMPGDVIIDLSSIDTWVRAGNITDVRIDSDSPGACPVISIKDVSVGRTASR